MTVRQSKVGEQPQSAAPRASAQAATRTAERVRRRRDAASRGGLPEGRRLEESREGIRVDHDSEILMFDVPPPLLSRGLDAYMASWETFFSRAEKPVAFDFRDVTVTAGEEVAFATAIGHCVDVDPMGKREELKFRLTMGLRKINGRWRITHEHHSLSAL